MIWIHNGTPEVGPLLSPVSPLHRGVVLFLTAVSRRSKNPEPVFSTFRFQTAPSNSNFWNFLKWKNQQRAFFLDQRLVDTGIWILGSPRYGGACCVDIWCTKSKQQQLFRVGEKKLETQAYSITSVNYVLWRMITGQTIGMNGLTNL